MYKICKIRCYPNKTQIQEINKIFGACRFARNKYNEYIRCNGYIPYTKYSVILNELKKCDELYMWINKISSKAIKDALNTEDKRWKSFMIKRHNKETCCYPYFISRKKIRKESFFFIKDNIRLDKYSNKNIISIPILGKIRITNHKYLPDKHYITSGYLVKEDSKYYLCIRYWTDIKKSEKVLHAMGCDLGISNFISITRDDNESIVCRHFMHNRKYKLYKKKIEVLQRIISHKAEMNYGRLLNQWMDKHHNDDLSQKQKNIMKGESYNTSCIRRLNKKIRSLNKKISNIRLDYIRKLVRKIVVRTKSLLTETIYEVPEYITIEDLSIKRMLTKDNNRKLHSYIQESGWYLFRILLESMCIEYSCELRIADKYFASSKTCCICGWKNKQLTLSDRIFYCMKCGNKVDRDLNASVNLLYTKKYSLVK